MKKLIVIIIISCLFVNSGNAQSETSSFERKIPTLNDHSFPSLDHFQNSFISTSLQANLGIGMTSPFSISGIQIDDHELFTFEGQLLFITMNIEYQQRFNPWLSLYFTIRLAGRVGTDMSTILLNGVNTVSGGDIGWLIRLKQSKKFNLSTKVYIQKLSGNFINVAEYFEEVINDHPNPTVIKKVPAMYAGLGLVGAYAFNSTFGLQFYGQYSYGESFERGKTGGYMAAGIAGDVDFKPKHNAPLGLTLAYTLTGAPEVLMAESGSANLFSGKIGYTGSDEFELGLQYTFYKMNLESVDSKPYINTIVLLLKFYF